MESYETKHCRERRAKDVERVAEMLANGPNTVASLASDMHLPSTYVEGLVRGLRRDGRVGLVSRTLIGKNSVLLYGLKAPQKPCNLPVRRYVDKATAAFMVEESFVPCMGRDPLVAALFGQPTPQPA